MTSTCRRRGAFSPSSGSLVDKEDKQNPLSDDDLVVELKKLGMNVARRTITKYRQKMDIPSSRQRKDWSKVASAN